MLRQLVTQDILNPRDGTGVSNILPVASFTHEVTGLSVDFTDTSTDEDGTIVAWAWDFGDGGDSTDQDPTHVYASGGTYTVALTVTDDGGDIHTVEHDVEPIAVTVDGPGSVYVPTSGAMWALLGLPQPTGLWGYQDNADSVAATIGNALVSSGGNRSGMVWQQTVTGWTRKFMGMDNQAGQKGWYFLNTQYVPNATSFCFLLYAGVGVGGALEFFHGASGNHAALRVEASNRVSYLLNEVPITSAQVHGATGAATIRPYLYGRNVQTSAAPCFTDLETWSTTYHGGAGGGGSNLIGHYSYNNAMPDLRLGLIAYWQGADAETVLAKTTLQTLGWQLPY